MELQQQLDKFFVSAGKRPYEYKRGPQSRTLIRQWREQHALNTQEQPSNEYPKELVGLWAAKIDPESTIFDNQDHESGGCSCKCTPIPKEIRSRHSERKEVNN